MVSAAASMIGQSITQRNERKRCSMPQSCQVAPDGKEKLSPLTCLSYFILNGGQSDVALTSPVDGDVSPGWLVLEGAAVTGVTGSGPPLDAQCVEQTLAIDDAFIGRVVSEDTVKRF